MTLNGIHVHCADLCQKKLQKCLKIIRQTLLSNLFPIHDPYFIPSSLRCHPQTYVGLSRRQAMSVHTFNMVLYAVLIPVGGWLSDRVRLMDA